MLKSKAHIKIGSYEFLLDETIDAGSNNLYRPHYQLSYNSLFQPKVAISGSGQKESIRSERLLWFVDDFSGGENNRVWTPDDPTVYNYGYGANTRIRGQLTGRPSRAVVAVGANTDSEGDVRDRPVFATAGGYIWLLGSQAVVANSNSATTWNEMVSSTIWSGITATGYRITAATGDNNYVYYSAFLATTGTNTGSRVLTAIQIQSPSSFAGISGGIQAPTTGKAPYAGMAILQGLLYAWTGNVLWRIDISDPTQWPLAVTGSTYVTNVSGNLGLNIPSTNVFGTNWWANCVATEHSVICFVAFDGQSHVYEYDLHGKGFTEIWTPAPGFTIKAMKYQNGVIFMSGHWGGDSNQKGFGALYAMKMNTREITQVSFARKQNLLNLELQEMAQSYGNTVLVAAARTGRTWVYDGDLDSYSMLDTMATSGTGAGSIEDAFPQVASTDSLLFVGNDHRIGDMLTWGPNRYVVVYRPGSASASDSAYSDYSYRVVNYLDDEPANRQAATTSTDYITQAEFGTWDYDVPFGQKMLYGFDVSYAPLTTGQSFWLQYATDDGAWKTTTVYTSASTDASKGRTFIDLTSVTNPVKFYELKWRIYVKATGNGILPPIIKGVCAEAQVIDYDITFELLVRVKQPQERTRGGTSATMQSPKRVRDYLKALKTNKSPVTFLDGYVSEIPGIYDSYTVMVEDVVDYINRPGEGTMRVRMRTIPT